MKWSLVLSKEIGPSHEFMIMYKAISEYDAPILIDMGLGSDTSQWILLGNRSTILGSKLTLPHLGAC